MLMLLTLSFSLASCNDDDDEKNGSPLVGTWMCNWGEGDYTMWTFKADGTGVSSDFGSSGSDTDYFTYTYSNGVLKVYLVDGDVEEWEGVIKNGVLYVDDVVFYRVK